MEEETRRKIEVDGVGDLYIGTPTADDIRMSDWTYSKTYNDALIQGITTSAEMQDILKKKGLIGEEYNKTMQDLRMQVGEKIVTMELSSDKNERKTLAIEIARLRDELFAWNQRLHGPMSHTCEQMAEDAKIEHLASCIVQRLDGSKIWKSFNEYKQEKNRTLCFRVKFEVMLYLQGLDTDFLSNTPENRVLRELNEDSENNTLLENKEEVSNLESSKEKEELVVEKIKPKKSKKVKEKEV